MKILYIPFYHFLSIFFPASMDYYVEVRTADYRGYMHSEADQHPVWFCVYGNEGNTGTFLPFPPKYLIYRAMRCSSLLGGGDNQANF